MSSWTYIDGLIKVDGITKQGILAGFGLRKNISEEKFDAFCNDLTNFDIDVNKRFDLDTVVKDYTKQVNKILESIPTPSGSEGPIEYCVGNYPQSYKLWKEGNWSGNRTLNIKENRFVSEYYEEENDEKDLKDVWESSIGDHFVLCLYGSLRDRTFEETKEELIRYIKELNKYFYMDYIDIRLRENCSEDCRISIEMDRKLKQYLRLKQISVLYELDGKTKNPYHYKTKKEKKTEKIYIEE